MIPSETGSAPMQSVKRSYRTLLKVSAFAQMYFSPVEIPAMLEEILPYFSTSFTEGAYVVAGLLNLLFPTSPPPVDAVACMPKSYLPTFFHLWSLMNRSRVFDTTFLDLLSRLARDHLPAQQVDFTEYGIFTKEQSSWIFTAVLRLLEIPVGQASSPYSTVIDNGAGLAIMLERDLKKHPVAHHIARFIVMSLSPACLDKSDSILANLESLIQAVETFFHPSNSGPWTKLLSQLVYYLTDFFVMRWNRERSGELEMPEERKLDDALKRRFVLCLREVVFMGIYAKSTTAMNSALSSLQSLAYLEPHLVLPGALQRIYPSLQGLVEVHRTTSSLRALQVLTTTMVRTKGFRCHITTILGLALPGIDANDLEKTLYTLSYIQSICYSVPLHDLTQGKDDVGGSMLAMDFITSEVARMEEEGIDFKTDYQNGLSDTDEEMILRSSTSNLSEFLSSLLGRVFTLLENLPDASRPRTGSPEENVVNILPAAFTPLFAALSPELYDIALNKIVDFVSNHVINQARDAVAFICSSLCKVNPTRALKRLVPILIQSIRTEIDENGAASTRYTGADVLPRDRGLVWAVSMLSMSVVHVGDAVLEHRQELFDIAVYMQQKCIGLPTTHISNCIHHLLLSLTGTYTVDYSLYEPTVIAKGIRPKDWGGSPDPQDLTISWHVPNKEELRFAVDLLKSQGGTAVQRLQKLTDGTSNVKRDGVGKEWSDEVSRNLVLVRLLLSGVSVLFDPKVVAPEKRNDAEIGDDTEMIDSEDVTSDDQEADSPDASLATVDDEEAKPTFTYPAGYLLHKDDDLYKELHDFREQTGQVLHQVHQHLTEKQEDDVACFEALCNAYKSWFVDVGIERSAHVLDRVTRLYAADIHPYKVAGLRKEYPRPLLLRRASVYHLQRLRHNSYPRRKSRLSKQLFIDLAQSSVSAYRDVRRHAQSAGEAALKAIIGSRLIVIPPLIVAFESGVKENNFYKIKGAMYSLLFGTLNKTLGRDWRYAPRVIRTFIKACTTDKDSIQSLCDSAAISIITMGRPLDRMAILDDKPVQAIAPIDDVQAVIDSKRKKLGMKRAKIEAKKADLSEELVELASHCHWKQASRVGKIVVTLGLRFEHIASESMIELVTKGTVDSHPGLRGLYAPAFIALLSVAQSRATANHSYENYLLDKSNIPSKIEVATQLDSPTWTTDYLESFAKPQAEYYIDQDYPGWLVWDKHISARKVDPEVDREYDEVENKVRAQVGKLLDREWYSTFFTYLRQEPRDAAADRFRATNAMMLGFTFDLLHAGCTTATLDDIQALVGEMWTENPDKHQHRATAEILGALLLSIDDLPFDYRVKIWEYVYPVAEKVLADGLTPENLTYWTTFSRLIVQGKDPRRSWPLVDWLASFKLDMDSNAAFKESSKIKLLAQCVSDLGWHFRLEKPILKNFLAHLDHPYKGVREAMGLSLSVLFRTRYHESYRDVPTLIREQRDASSLGTQPYKPSKDFSDTFHEVFARLEKWGEERTPGQQTPSSYTNGSKTVLLWLDTTLASYDSTQLVPFFPGNLMEQLLYMMDVKEDQELQGLAYHVFKHIPNIPHRIGEDAALIDALVRIATTSTLWHQRLRVLINMQVIYFRRLFLVSDSDQQILLDCVAVMLEDTRLEVRLGASTSLSGMIRCSRAALQSDTVQNLTKKFTKMLLDSPLPKKSKNAASNSNSGTSTPTPENSKIALTRHAAVLGLGALVQAFPYKSPPPSWIPGVLTTLANKANNDPGMVGKSVKSILSDFKKTRQDTWQMDLKVSRHCYLQRTIIGLIHTS